MTITIIFLNFALAISIYFFFIWREEYWLRKWSNALKAALRWKYYAKTQRSKFNLINILGGPSIIIPHKELKKTCSTNEVIIMGVNIQKENRFLFLYLNNFGRIFIRFDWFNLYINNINPNFDNPKIINGGRTLQLGEYKLNIETLLESFDDCGNICNPTFH